MIASEDVIDLEAARRGDRGSFERIVRPALPRMRAVIRRMIGDVAEVDDLMQESLTRAWTSIAKFDERAELASWLCKIAINATIDHLRAAKRWRARAQVAYANECATDMALATEVGEVLSSPAFQYDAREHVAFCFTCVARSLDPDQQAALVLREVEGMTNLEAARALDVTESVLRHRLSEARATMEREFEGLCALVNKRGVCYQCRGLRDAVAETAKGEPPPALPSLDERLAIVRAADVDRGASQALHDLFWRRIRRHEQEERGSITVGPECEPDEPTS